MVRIDLPGGLLVQCHAHRGMEFVISSPLQLPRDCRCSRRFCTPSWLQKPVQKWFRPLQVDSSEGGAQDVKSSSPETEEQQNAKLFDAADYNSMNVIFEPMQEPLSKLERLLAELRQHADLTSRDSRQ